MKAMIKMKSDSSFGESVLTEFNDPSFNNYLQQSFSGENHIYKFTPLHRFDYCFKNFD